MKIIKDEETSVERGYGFAMGVLKALFVVFIMFPICAGIIIAVIGALIE